MFTLIYYNAIGCNTKVSLPNGVVNSYTYDAGNRLLEDADYYYDYDKNGNTTQKLSKTTGELSKLYYDAENQLIKLEKYHSMSDTVPYSSVSYIYDGLGRRVAKNIDSAITKYVYDQEDILLETDVSDSIIARYTHGPGIDEPVSMDRGGSSYYYIADALGSIAKVIDAVGNVINRYVYNSFGNIVEKTEGVANPYTYTGREYDPESGLYYYRARYYDSKTGRFISEDPVGFLGGINFFTYAGNNPIKYFDPLGLIIKVQGDATSYNKAKKYLSQDPAMSKIIKELENSKTVYTVKTNRNNNDSFEISTKVINWDPFSALRITCGGTQSPALGLGHEMTHAAGNPLLRFILSSIPWEDYGNLEEWRVIKFTETSVAKTLGEDIRTDHYGIVFSVTDPTRR